MTPAGEAGAGEDPPWADPARAAALLAVDPAGLGGVLVRASAGPVRDRWLGQFESLLSPGEAWRRMPARIADDRLLGGLDLAATLQTGQPVAQKGLLAEVHGGGVIVPMAERMTGSTAARLAAALDEGEIGFERDGVSRRWPARIAVVALDEGGAEDAAPPVTLGDRLALRVDLGGLSLRDCGEPAARASQILHARANLARVEVPQPIVQGLCATALLLGVDSLRASVASVRAARAAAALAGREVANEDDARLAARLVLGPRATRLPPAPEQEDAPEAAAPPAPQDDSQQADDRPPGEPQEGTLEDRLVAAAQAALTGQWLAALQARERARESGRVGQLSAAPRGGRPMGSRAGAPRGGARLNLIDTLRAAAPWQPLRERQRQRPAGAGDGLHIRADDLRVSRMQQRSATATIFVIDASGSSALHRLGEAKGAVNLLLADCYVRRDQVGVIAFRGRAAEVLLAPTRSLVRARRSLAALPGGGGTPLASGLEAAVRMAAQVRRAGAVPVVVVLTDGRANISRQGEPGRAAAEEDARQAARLLRAQRLTSLLVDTSAQPAAAAQRLAAEMGAIYRALPYAGASELCAAVQALPRPGP